MSRSTKVELEFSLFLTELQEELARHVPPEQPAWIKRPLKEFKNLLPPLFAKYRWMFAQDAAETWKSRGVERAIWSNETRIAGVIKRAAYDRAASQGLHDYIRDQMKSEEPLAPAAKAYLDALLAGEIPPPKSPAGRPATTERRVVGRNLYLFPPVALPSPVCPSAFVSTTGAQHGQQLGFLHLRRMVPAPAHQPS